MGHTLKRCAVKLMWAGWLVSQCAFSRSVAAQTTTTHPSTATATAGTTTVTHEVLRHLAVSLHSFHLAVEGYVQPTFLCPDCNVAEEHEALLEAVQQHCRRATVLQSNVKIVNRLTLDIPFACVEDRNLRATDATTSSVQRVDTLNAFVQTIDALPQVKHAYPSSTLYPTSLNGSVEYLGALLTTQNYCVKGQGVRIAIIDSGLDYTHQALGGNGTMEAYLQAYGSSPTDPANTVRGPYFPTERVVDGYDFVGDLITPSNVDWSLLSQDDDPIDGALGHGTAVAHALLGVAGEASLVALKVCVPVAGCPETAIYNAIEYALDPNGDGDTSDHVDIINLSLGRPYTHPYYSPMAQVIEDAFSLGVLTVVAAGNLGNRPGIIFEAASSPNAIAVGATGVAESTTSGGMAPYSSRGPGALAIVKPDIVAPGGPFDLAASGTGDIYHEDIEGTSYATPLVAGAAALLMQWCPECSPFAIKSILLNSASRTVKYSTVDPTQLAPISWAGAGELQIFKAISADFWAYNVDDAQPSLSLGVLNVDKDIVITKVVRVTLLDEFSSSAPLNLEPSFQFRDPAKASIMNVSFSPSILTLDRNCQATADVEVSFSFTAKNVPTNHMTSAGKDSVNAALSLDINEVDGWVVLTDISLRLGKDISLPMHAMVRRAANVVAERNDLFGVSAVDNERLVPVGLRNIGAATAQIDTYELVHTSDDDPELGFGSGTPPTDIRYVGYRTIPVGLTGRCDYVVEFAFHTWETVETTVNAFFEAEIDRDSDGTVDVIISNRGPQQHKTVSSECRVFDVSVGRWTCASFAPDHVGYSRNTVIRACSNALGLDASTTTTMQVRFNAISYSRSFITTDDVVAFSPIVFPEPALRGPSFNMAPNSEWSHIFVEGAGQTPGGQDSMGLLLITNGYRSDNSTGASTLGTEALVFTRPWVPFYPQSTEDLLQPPKATDFAGPLCEAWKAQVTQSCNPFDNPAISSVLSFGEVFGIPSQPNPNGPPLNGETCLEVDSPQLELSTLFPTSAPTDTPTSSPVLEVAPPPPPAGQQDATRSPTASDGGGDSLIGENDRGIPDSGSGDRLGILWTTLLGGFFVVTWVM